MTTFTVNLPKDYQIPEFITNITPNVWCSIFDMLSEFKDLTNYNLNETNSENNTEIPNQTQQTIIKQLESQ